MVQDHTLFGQGYQEKLPRWLTVFNRPKIEIISIVFSMDYRGLSKKWEKMPGGWPEIRGKRIGFSMNVQGVPLCVFSPGIFC